MIKNADEARETIQAEFHPQTLNTQVNQAKGYLAALSGPEVKALVYGISEFMDIMNDGPDDSDVVHAFQILKESLAQYRDAAKEIK